MQQTTSTAVLRHRTLAVVTLAVTLMAIFNTPALADSDHSRRTIVGAWKVQVTLRDCVTNAPQGPPFNSLVTFHHGGTISEAAGGVAFAPGQRSPGHGVWTRERGHTYEQSMVALVNFDTPPNLPGTPGFDPGKPVSPGFLAGWVTITHTVTPTNANNLTSKGTNAFYKPNGEVYRTGCSTAVAQRF